MNEYITKKLNKKLNRCGINKRSRGLKWTYANLCWCDHVCQRENFMKDSKKGKPMSLKKEEGNVLIKRKNK